MEYTKNNFKVENRNIEFRRATAEDNFAEIAELIYLTDPYIYPFWFNNNIEEAKKYLSSIMLKPGHLFHIDNFYIALDKTSGHIVGVLCAIDKSVALDYDYSADKQINERYRFTIENYIYSVEQEIRESSFSDFLYISNVCVAEGCRGKRIGSYLIGYFIDQMEKNGFNTFALDCLLHNLRAKNLYHSMGFKEMQEIVGFDGTDHSTVEVVSFLRKRGTYYPTEFQVSFIDRQNHKYLQPKETSIQ